MGIYGKNGYIDVNKIKKNPFIVMVGARRTGKTYGVMKYLLENNARIMYLRRTTGELELSMTDSHFAFKVMENEGMYIKAKKDSKYSYILQDCETDEIIGNATSLTLVAKMRGYDASEITDIMYDEFIPERHVNKISHEGDAVLNMYETINGNRELQGTPPVRLWMLANSNNLNSEVLQAFGLVEKIESMLKRKQEYSEYRNITIVLSAESPISKMKENTALYTAIRSNGKFAEMALHNNFAYNDNSNIAHEKLIEYVPRCRIGDYVLLDHKSEAKSYFVKNQKIPVAKVYKFSTNSATAFRIANSDLLNRYIWGRVFFDSWETKNKISEILPFISS